MGRKHRRLRLLSGGCSRAIVSHTIDETDASRRRRLPTMDGKFAHSNPVGLCPLPCRRPLATQDEPLTGCAWDTEWATSTSSTSPTVPSTFKVSSASFVTLTLPGPHNLRATSTPSRPPPVVPSSVQSTPASCDSLDEKASKTGHQTSTPPTPLRCMQPCHPEAHHRRDGRTPTPQTPDAGWQVCPFYPCWVVPSAL